jgi:hypothetical protein
LIFLQLGELGKIKCLSFSSSSFRTHLGCGEANKILGKETLNMLGDKLTWKGVDNRQERRGMGDFFSGGGFWEWGFWGTWGWRWEYSKSFRKQGCSSRCAVHTDRRLGVEVDSLS